MLCESSLRRRSWSIEAHHTKTLTTSLGNVAFRKTLFLNKQTKERSYLLDHILGLEPNQRLTEDAVDRMLEEAVQTSYQRGKQQVSLGTQGSRQTVKNKSCADKEISRENQLPYFRRPILFIMGWFFVLLKSVIPN